MIGRGRLHPPYAAFVSTGAARVTQMLEILRRAAGQDDVPITPATGLRSSAEGRWRDAAKAAGRGADLDAIRAVDPELVEQESSLLAAALRQVVTRLPEDGRALVVGHSPPARPPCSGWPAGLSRHWARAKGPADRGARGLPGRAAGLNGGERFPHGARWRGTEFARVAGGADCHAGPLLPWRNGIFVSSASAAARCGARPGRRLSRRVSVSQTSSSVPLRRSLNTRVIRVAPVFSRHTLGWC